MEYFIGIDIGTTHTKAVIIDADGHPFFEEKKGYDILHPEMGFEEQDPILIMDAVTEVIAKSIAAIGNNDKIAAISFSAAMHSILPVDSTGKPLYNSVIWADTRSKKEAAEVAATNEAAQLYSNTGIPLHPMSPFCKILWFRSQLPDVYNKTCRFISIKEFVFFKLFGKYVVDHSIASATGLFNLRQKKWDQLALKIAGIDEGKLSYPVSTLHQEVELLPYYRDLFGISENIPFVVGSSDGCLANLGSGAVDNGQTAVTVGTSGAVRMTVREEVKNNNDLQGLFKYPLIDDLFVSGGAINNGGIILKWLSDLFIDENPTGLQYEELLSIAEKVKPGANGLLFLPYLLGERAPVWDADAKGALVGLTLTHKKEHVVRAALEGVCFILTQLIRKLEGVYGYIEEIYASGGFVRSPLWVQMISDISGKKIKVNEDADASAIGAAYLAMYASGKVKELNMVKKFVKVSREYGPDAENHQLYKKQFELFNSLYPKLKDDFAALSRLQEN